MPGNKCCTKLQIANIKGLHARASAMFVKCVERFEAEAYVSREGQTVGGDSIMGLMMLGASKGCTIDVECSGPQAKELCEALVELVDDKFGEGE